MKSGSYEKIITHAEYCIDFKKKLLSNGRDHVATFWCDKALHLSNWIRFL